MASMATPEDENGRTAPARPLPNNFRSWDPPVDDAILRVSRTTIDPTPPSSSISVESTLITSPQPLDSGSEKYRVVEGHRERLSIGIDLDKFAPDSMDEPAQSIVDSHWIQVGDQKYQKASVVSSFLKSERARKVIEHTLRAQGLTLQDLRRSSDYITGEVTGKENFLVGDIATTLMRTDDYIFLSVIQVSAFEMKGVRVRQINVDDLADKDKGIIVHGQVIDLIQSGNSWNSGAQKKQAEAQIRWRV